jgi:DeoR/GlpR family transcriptional regulator of sugar metabolism
MLTKQRQKLLLDYITAHKSAAVTTLCEEFGISISTVRRDLIELEQSGVISRVHGGAVLTQNNNELPILQRSVYQSEEKKRIGAAAAKLVDDNDTIMITGGTTIEAMLPFLGTKNNLTVITNSISNAFHLSQYPDIAVVMLGGWLRHAEFTVHGPITESSLKELQPQKMFHGIFGICPDTGLTGADLQEVQTDRFLISSIPKLVILADHTKFCRSGPVRVASFDVVDTVVTDTQAPEEDVRVIRERGVEVILS